METTIGIIYWGNSEEKEISKKSASNVYNNIDTNRFFPVMLKLYDVSRVMIEIEGKEVDAFNYSNPELIINGVRRQIDIIIIHGKPAENGLLQKKLESHNLPYVSSNSKVTALTFDKREANLKLQSYGFKTPEQILYTDQLSIDEIIYPVVIKPADSGSSFGVTKASNSVEARIAVNKAKKYSDKIIIERFIKGREFACGGYYLDGKYVALPVTEIIFDSEIFDYEAKYCGKSEEITPANIDESLTQEIQIMTVDIAKCFGLEAFFRIDYLYEDNKLYQIETNSIPGLSNESIYPKMLKSEGIALKNLLTELINDKLKI